MSFNELNNEFDNYLNERFSPEDRRKFLQWITADQNEERVKQFLNEELKNYHTSEKIEHVDFENLYSKISKEINHYETTPATRNKTTRLLVNILKVAAIVLVAVVSTLIVNKQSHPKHLFQPEVVIYEIKAPLGAKTEITLPDGSRVWLNAGSKLKYNAAFSFYNRDIILDGEAFFKVAKNKNIPFIVKTSDIDIKAVGTSFNVKAYSDEGTIETTLVEGTIAITRSGVGKNKSKGEFMLTPNQRATFIKEKTSIEITDVRKFIEELPPKIKVERGKVYIIPEIDPLPTVAWKDNLMIIRGEEMRSLVIKLGRKYNVHISILGEYLNSYRFSGTLYDETLEQVLNVIKLSAPIDYTIDGKEVVIKENAESIKRFKRLMKENTKP
ncbi:MAG TPA: FecR family protein [Bacteroidales bacterium]|nr:FecR family protein [Bacteroidales bacterium]